MAEPPMGRLLQFDLALRHQDAGQGGVTPVLSGPFSPGYAERNRLRALSWLSHTVAQLVEKRGAVPIGEIDAAIAEGNAILRTLALLDFAAAADVAGYDDGTRSILAVQERIERWRRALVG